MNEACIMMKINGEVDDNFIRNLKKHFPQVTDLEKDNEPFNMIVHLQFRNSEEFKELYNNLHPWFKGCKVREEVIVVDEL